VSDRPINAPSWPPAAAVSVWGQLTVVPFTSGDAASPSVTWTIPLPWSVTEMLAIPDNESSNWSRWSSRSLALMPAACIWLICPLSWAIWLASVWITPVGDAVSVWYCCAA